MYPVYMVRFDAPDQVIGTSHYPATHRNVICEGTQSVRCYLEDGEIMEVCARAGDGKLEVFKMVEGSLEFKAIPKTEIAKIIRAGYKWHDSTTICDAVRKMEAV